MTGLVARTIRIDSDVDLISVGGHSGVLFEQAGTGLAGRGVAARIVLPNGPGRLDAAAEATQEVLGSIETHDEVGCIGSGPIAFGALPFDEQEPAELIVPSLVVGRSDDGTRWVTTVEKSGRNHQDGEELLRELLLEGQIADDSPSSFRVEAVQDPQSWCDSVGEAVKVMASGRLKKVVLTREILVEANSSISITEVLRRLRHAYPSSMLYAIDGFVGATPELLVSRIGDVLRSHPMAGTAPRFGDSQLDARQAASLLSSKKDRDEHQITIDMVLDAVLPFCSYVDSEPEPSIVSVANVHHLASLVEGRLSSPPASVLTLVGALHPTPAVCGEPRELALDLIGRLEPHSRGRYTGPVGWVDAQGNGRFAVAIRCAAIQGRTARLFAGNGLVADSDPTTELAETRAKLQALLGAIIRP